jgi:hypothetical protein
VDRSNRLALLYTTVVVAVWAIGLPGALILDEIGSFDPPWRGWGLGVGGVLVALGPPIAVELPVLWMVPVIGFVYFALGIGLLEDRHLLETFETEFRSYRAAVAKWFPIR